MEIDPATKLEMNRRRNREKLVMWIAVCGLEQRDDDTALTWSKFCTFCDTNGITRLYHFTRMKIEAVEQNTNWLSLTPIDRQGLCSLFGMNSTREALFEMNQARVAACRTRAVDGFNQVCAKRHEILNIQTQIDVHMTMIGRIYELSNTHLIGYDCIWYDFLEGDIMWQLVV